MTAENLDAAQNLTNPQNPIFVIDNNVPEGPNFPQKYEDMKVFLLSLDPTKFKSLLFCESDYMPVGYAKNSGKLWCLFRPINPADFYPENITVEPNSDNNPDLVRKVIRGFFCEILPRR